MLNNHNQQDIQIQIYHQLIGHHTFHFHQHTHIHDLRNHIIDNSPLYIHHNFHLQSHQQPLYEYYDLAEIFKADARLTVVFDPYDYYSSKHHYNKVREIINNPIKWTIINNRDLNFKQLEDFEQNYAVQPLQNIFESPFGSVFLNNNQKEEGQFGNMVHLSGFNPVPSDRRFQGDLYYIHVKTIEETDMHITASVDGFYVNLSHQNHFNPNPNSKYSSHISFLDLLQQISPKFKCQFQLALKNTKITQFQRILYTFKASLDKVEWMKESNGWRKGNVWCNDGERCEQWKDFSMVKDWMQIFQYYRMAVSETLYDKMNKEKLKFKIYNQFSQCAKEGVMKIFKGELKPINSANRFIHHIYYYEYLLFYFVSDDQKDQLPSSEEVNREIINQHFLQQLQTDNLYLSNIIVIKFRGYKIAVRTFPTHFITENITINNIHELFKQTDSIESDESFAQVIRRISKQLGLQSENSFTNEKGQNVNIIIHPEINGCITSDKKKILLNVTKFSPRDLNFQGIQAENCFLRPEIMNIYNFKQKCSIPYNSMIRTKYRIPHSEKNKVQQKKLVSLARFAKQVMIPAFIDSFDEQMRKCLSDTRGIIQNLHRHGLSSKYLGMIYLKAIEKKSFHVKIMIQRAILIKSLKNLFRKALRETPLFYHKTILKHLLNCLYAEQQLDSTIKHNGNEEQVEASNNNGKKSKKRKNKEPQTFFQISFSKSVQKYAAITSQEFWKQLEEISLVKFKHKLSAKESFFKFEWSKTAILRDICICVGIEVEKRDYFSGESLMFSEQHILCMVPRIKLVISESKQLNELIEQGDKLVNKYQLQQAFEAYNKALQYVFNVYNGIHEKLALINKKIAAIYFKVGDLDTATLSALNAAEIYEKLLGEDHVQTIQALMTVGVYQFSGKKYSAAEFYILKALFLAKFCYSECYPEVIIIYLNLSTVYETQKKYTDAIMSLFMALNISIKVYGEKHLHTAIVFSALASLHFEIPDIEQCIKYQQKAINILEQLVGVEDERVVEARNVCQSYKNLQSSKKIREVHEKEQKNLFSSLQNNKINFKLPFYDFKERPNDFIWKKNKKMKYFF